MQWEGREKGVIKSGHNTSEKKMPNRSHKLEVQRYLFSLTAIVLVLLNNTEHLLVKNDLLKTKAWGRFSNQPASD